MTRRAPVLFLTVFSGLVWSWRVHAQEARFEFETPSRIVAIGDVHGACDTFVKVLRATGLVDQKLDWVGGSAHSRQVAATRRGRLSKSARRLSDPRRDEGSPRAQEACPRAGGRASGDAPGVAGLLRKSLEREFHSRHRAERIDEKRYRESAPRGEPPGLTPADA